MKAKRHNTRPDRKYQRQIEARQREIEFNTNCLNAIKNRWPVPPNGYIASEIAWLTNRLSTAKQALADLEASPPAPRHHIYVSEAHFERKGWQP